MKENSKGKPLFDAHVFSTKARDALQFDLSTCSSRSEYHSVASRLWVEKLLSKFCLPGDNLAREEAAISKFLAVNDEMRICNTRLDHLSREAVGSNFAILMRARFLIGSVLGDEVPIHEVHDACRHSGGATVGVPKKDTSLEAKWKAPLTYCNNALPYFTSLLADDYELRSAVMGLNGLPSTMELDEAIALLTMRVRGSRSTTVPKDNSIDRFIAVEPTINMFLQQGLEEVMWRKMRKWGLSLERDQEKHRKLACWGSVTNHLATIDFSSMSDRVSCSIIKLLFPAEWCAAFMDLRSKETFIKGDFVKCSMISSMGNATTFPLETLILWALAVAVSEGSSTQSAVLKRTRDDIGVFGDDVILPSRHVPLFISIVRLCGFEINAKKSFYGEQYFRESCGGDFYHGRDVRPIYLKAFPSSRSRVQCEAHLYTLINRVISKYKSYFGTLTYVYDKQLLRFLFDCLKTVTSRIKFVPVYFPEDAGICELPDVERLSREYTKAGDRSPVLVDVHGCLFFRYLSWNVPERERSDHLRFADWLRRKARSENSTEWVDIFWQSRANCPSAPFVSSSDLRKFAMSLVVQTPMKRTTREFGKYVTAVSKLRLVTPKGYDPGAWRTAATTLTLVRGKVPS